MYQYTALVLSCWDWSSYVFFFFMQKTAYEMRISDWSSDVCSSDLSELGTKDFVADFRRRPPVHPTPAELAPLAGDYHVSELDITYSIRLDGDHLVAASLWSSRPIRLVPVAPDRFDTDSIPLGSIAVERDEIGRAHV